ncbi:MAG TPA: c-type cytochrome [Acidobacteriaceae bacterium]|nr:c-type cytochrome [Acidobacteriaceae bacterium]
MSHRAVWLPAGLTILLLGCRHQTEQYVLPDQVTDFSALYASNCAGCHGQDGRSGPARPLNDPLFLAVIGKERLRDVIANGVPGKAMPAFAQSAGGTLTDQQISIVASEVEARWSRPQEFVGVALPPYTAELGDAKHGAHVFRGYCARCHGEDGTGSAKGGSVVNPAYLALVSDQSLRTTVIAGRAGQGSPDWRSDEPGHAMSQQEISDVVAWLSAQRPLPGEMAKGGATAP